MQCAANSECARLTMERSAQAAAPGLSKAARKTLNEAYATLVQLLNALAIVYEDNGIYAETFAKINGRIKHYEDVLAQRSGAAAAKQQGD